MKHLHDPVVAADMRSRLSRMTAASPALWGKMTAPQAVAHMANGLEMALGDDKPPRMFAGRMFGRFVKRLVFRDESPLKRNTPTAPTLLIRDDRDFERERQRLERLITRFAEGGEKACTTHPHTFFGDMTAREWAILQYKHLDHHLRQFGV